MLQLTRAGVDTILSTSQARQVHQVPVAGVGASAFRVANAVRSMHFADSAPINAYLDVDFPCLHPSRSADGGESSDVVPCRRRHILVSRVGSQDLSHRPYDAVLRGQSVGAGPPWGEFVVLRGVGQDPLEGKPYRGPHGRRPSAQRDFVSYGASGIWVRASFPPGECHVQFLEEDEWPGGNAVVGMPVPW